MASAMVAAKLIACLSCSLPVAPHRKQNVSTLPIEHAHVNVRTAAGLIHIRLGHERGFHPVTGGNASHRRLKRIAWSQAASASGE